MLTIAQHLWNKYKGRFSVEDWKEVQRATVGKTEAPLGFIVDLKLLSESLAAKVRFHFVVKTGRVGRGAAL